MMTYYSLVMLQGAG